MSDVSEDEIRLMVRQVLREERDAMEEKLDTNTIKTIAAILTGFGIDEDEKKEVKEDFRYLRRWRKGSERMTGVGMTAVIMLFVGGAASALWLGFKTIIGKP